MDEDTTETLRRSIFSAFDKWCANYIIKLKKPRSDKNKEETQKESYFLDLFLSKRVFIPGFIRHVTKEVSSNPVSKRHRKALIKACLLSIVNPDGVSAKELESDSCSDEGYTYTHIRRIIRDEYTETFFEANEKRKDERFTPYLSVFSPYELPEHINEELVRWLQIKSNIIYSKHQLKDWMLLNARIRPVIPEYLEDLVTFQKDALELLREIKYDSKMGKLLHTELKRLSDILLVFHAHFQSILAVEWWRNRQKKTQRTLIDKSFPLKYTKKDATTSYSLLLTLTNSEEHTFSIMLDAALAFNEKEMPKSAILLFEQYLKIDTLTHLQKGILHENIATMLRKQSNPKFMVQEMKKAVKYYSEAGETYRVCVGLKNLGEAEWYLGFKDTALRYFVDAESLSEDLDRANRADVFWNLAFAARRMGEKKMERDYLMKCINNCTEDQTKVLLDADKRLSVLMG